ncbi:MAG: hypothetical protein ICV58_01930 [Rubrobacteraceae bacterium]|nr:hypothetical protein [Rubrobacteraceae bacterium]
MVSVLVVVAGMIVASPAALAVLVKAADWQMNEPSGPMIDSSGNGNDGTPTDVVQTGSTYVFDGSTSHVVVPDDDSLDPAANDITITARVKVNGESLDDDSYESYARAFLRPRAATTRWR